MITFISRRFFITSSFILILFIGFTAITFAQETQSETRSEVMQSKQNTREKIMDRVSDKKEAVKKERDDYKTELKEKIDNLKDSSKSNVLERIADRIETTNDTRTSNWAQKLDRLYLVIDKIKTKSSEASGASTTRINVLIENAEEAIDEASLKVEAQSQKTYDLEIENEQDLKTTVKPLVQLFKTDLNQTLESVKNAKNLTREAARELSKISAGSESSQTSINP